MQHLQAKSGKFICAAHFNKKAIVSAFASSPNLIYLFWVIYLFWFVIAANMMIGAKLNFVV